MNLKKEEKEGQYYFRSTFTFPAFWSHKFLDHRYKNKLLKVVINKTISIYLLISGFFGDNKKTGKFCLWETLRSNFNSPKKAILILEHMYFFVSLFKLYITKCNDVTLLKTCTFYFYSDISIWITWYKKKQFLGLKKLFIH